MASNYIHIPRITELSPTAIRNENYEYLQATVEVESGGALTLFTDSLSNSGLYLYELRVAGTSNASFCTFKRTFTVRVTEQVEVLDISSDYTKRTSLDWTVAVQANDSTVLVSVTGASEPTKWILSLTKTFFSL